MITAETIQKQISEFVQSKIKVYPCNNLRASNIGHPCERYLYLLIKHWDEVKSHDETRQNIFDLGNSIEDYTIQKLKDAGLCVITPTNYSWKVENPLITGREDIRIRDDETGEFFPAEIKGLSPFEWERLNTIDDFYTSKKHYIQAYPSQLLVYCWKFEKEKGFFILTNKLTGQIKVIEVPFDWDRADALLKKGERIYECLENDILPEATDNFAICEDCPLRHICTADVKRTETDIDMGELEEMIDRKNDLAQFKREYEEVDAQIKAAIGDRTQILAGKYIVTVKTIHKDEYMVKAREERRVNIKRL